ncbi:MAG: hypothetical protein IT453_11545 [Planctomycetes bacterium]|nr:hypothetical protein [Planctomycetota bacterium]
MNALNGFFNTLFDWVLLPLEKVGPQTALIVVSGVFGVLALAIFKFISFQKGIASVKDRIKGHMIEIRLFQDDLAVVGSAVAKVLFRNVQYLALNFGPFIPLAIPFLFVTAQLVTRYAYEPAHVVAADAKLLPGQGTMLEVRLAEGREAEIAGLQVVLPAGVKALSPLVRSPYEGRAFQEVVATASGVHQLEFVLADGTRETKSFVAGDASLRAMQPRRVSSSQWWNLASPDDCAALWPAEPTFDSGSPFRSIALRYPDRDLGWLPAGEGGVLIAFVVASMLFGIAALKPLGVTI